MENSGLLPVFCGLRLPLCQEGAGPRKEWARPERATQPTGPQRRLFERTDGSGLVWGARLREVISQTLGSPSRRQGERAFRAGWDPPRDRRACVALCCRTPDLPVLLPGGGRRVHAPPPTCTPGSEGSLDSALCPPSSLVRDGKKSGSLLEGGALLLPTPSQGGWGVSVVLCVYVRQAQGSLAPSPPSLSGKKVGREARFP